MIEQTLPSDVTRQASLLFEGLGSPISLSAAVMLRYNEWDGLAALTVRPRDYTDAQSYFRDVAAASFLKKLQQLPTESNRRERAIAKWKEGEASCARTNLRLDCYMPRNLVYEHLDEQRVAGVEEFISSVRKIILSWIGPRPPEFLTGRFGPGATYSDRGGKTTVPDKMSAVPSLTRDAVWYLPQWLGTQWGASVAQHHGELSFVEGNRFATVPKTALIDRCIAAEPSINVFYQLALGKAIRTRLRNYKPDWSVWGAGWDLDIAQDIHKQIACESSVSSEFATLDLSNASDTVARSVVELLLPRDWFEALDDLRSKKTLLDGHWVVLEKFSSMGNGYTFELETIIFGAFACAVSRQAGYAGELGVDVFVFGDDIIIRDDLVRSLTAVLSFFGFALNEEKSFHGPIPFRESCGGDFFAGESVRPFYLKDLPNEPQDYVALANGLQVLNLRLDRAGHDVGLRAWFAVLDSLPSHIRRLRGPEGLGDAVIHDKEANWRPHSRDSIRYFKGIVPKKPKTVSWDHFYPDVVLACATYGTGDGTPTRVLDGSPRGDLRAGGVTPRGSISGYKLKWLPYS